MLDLPADHSDEKSRVLAAGVRAFEDLAPDAAAIDTAAQFSWAGMHGLVSLLLARPEFPFVDRETPIEAHLAREMV